MPQVPMQHALILVAILFTLGLAGLLTRRNLIFTLLCIEIMLNASGLAFVAAGSRWGQPDGQVMFLFILAMAAAGLGYAFMPSLSVDHPGVVGRALVDPEIWREVALVTVRGRPHSPGVGALMQEAMRTRWSGKVALAVEAARAEPAP